MANVPAFEAVLPSAGPVVCRLPTLTDIEAVGLDVDTGYLCRLLMTVGGQKVPRGKDGVIVLADWPLNDRDTSALVRIIGELVTPTDKGIEQLHDSLTMHGDHVTAKLPSGRTIRVRIPTVADVGQARTSTGNRSTKADAQLLRQLLVELDGKPRAYLDNAGAKWPLDIGDTVAAFAVMAYARRPSAEEMQAIQGTVRVAPLDQLIG